MRLALDMLTTLCQFDVFPRHTLMKWLFGAMGLPTDLIRPVTGAKSWKRGGSGSSRTAKNRPMFLFEAGALGEGLSSVRCNRPAVGY